MQRGERVPDAGPLASSAERPRQAVVLAGGRGTRLLPLTESRPKPMIEFHGRPFLEYLVDMLREQGFERVLLLLGHLPEVVMAHFGDGSKFGVRIEYDITDPDDLTGRRIEHAAERIDDTFLLLYCDNYWPMQIDDMWQQYVESGALAQVTVYANDDGYSRDCVRLRGDGMVDMFDRSRTAPDLGGVEIGFAILRKDVVLRLLPEHQELIEQAVYPALAEQGELHAYVTYHRYYSVGDHGRLAATHEHLARRAAVILDRDGVLNARPPRATYVTTPEQFHWLPGALDALRLLHEAGYLVLIVSNQAGIGRGMMSEEDLAKIHARMQSDVEAAGGRIDAVYHCPHDWDEGCWCRKPSPGLLFAAQRAHHLDLSRTYFIGDDERDEEAAVRAGCRSILVSEDRSLLDIVKELLAARHAGAPR